MASTIGIGGLVIGMLEGGVNRNYHWAMAPTKVFLGWNAMAKLLAPQRMEVGVGMPSATKQTVHGA